jgi:hypothetical protein
MGSFGMSVNPFPGWIKGVAGFAGACLHRNRSWECTGNTRRSIENANSMPQALTSHAGWAMAVLSPGHSSYYTLANEWPRGPAAHHSAGPVLTRCNVVVDTGARRRPVTHDGAILEGSVPNAASVLDAGLEQS